MSDFIPDSAENFHAWAQNLHEEILIHGPNLGWTAPEITAFQGVVAPLRDSAADVVQLQDDLDTATGALRQMRETTLPTLRQLINNIKSTAGYDPGMGAALGVVTGSTPLDPVTYKPSLRAAVYPGYVRLNGKKLGADSLNLYTRLTGQSPWALLASKRVRFPFDDQTPLAIPGTPQIREYRAIGVVGDNEIGQPSDIVTATFAG